MLRIGVHFEGMLAGEQARLDAYIFDCLREEARKWRHLRGVAPHGAEPPDHERRQARRVPVDEKGKLKLMLCPGVEEPMLSMQGTGDSWAGMRSLKLCDISVTGCAFLSIESEAPPTGTLLELTLIGDNLNLKIRGRVVYARPHTP